jgi:uncharacterized membrane protein YtjA (UPF0391 family)
VLTRFDVARRSPGGRLNGTLQPNAQSGASAGGTMLHWAIVFLVIAIIAAILGFGGIAASAAWIAKVIFVIFLIIAIITFFAGRGRVSPP